MPVVAVFCGTLLAGVAMGVAEAADRDLPPPGRPAPAGRVGAGSHDPGTVMPSGRGCQADPQLGVYHPRRLRVLRPCTLLSGTVVAVIHEPDGDVHVDVRPGRPFVYLLAPGNSQVGRAMVTEIIKGQRLPVPFAGEHVVMTGTWVYDIHHTWNEIHPIWMIRYSSGRTVLALPPVPPLH